MGRENKKEAIAALHKERIINASEELFSRKGFAQTTIDDISKASEYSRRTVYAYFDGKEDILYHIIEKGLSALKSDIAAAVNLSSDFIGKYRAICAAVTEYKRNYPQSAENVSSGSFSEVDAADKPQILKRIFDLGTEINDILAAFIGQGKADGAVRRDVQPMMTVYILWSGIDALISLTQTKGRFISNQLGISEDEFLNYGFTQIINSVLKKRI